MLAPHCTTDTSREGFLLLLEMQYWQIVKGDISSRIEATRLWIPQTGESLALFLLVNLVVSCRPLCN